jgi:type IV pilus assembly protein PilX
MTLRSSTSTSRKRYLHIGAQAESGFSLIVSLMMLIVIIILGISASQMAINEERGSRNDRDRQIAFQAAEAALKDAESEIYGTTGSLCTVPGQLNVGRMRATTSTCFNEHNVNGYALGCSAPPNNGLCLDNPATPTVPAYLDSANVDFAKDARGAGNNHTVAYGTFTLKSYATQQTSSTYATQPLSAYPPRYIIEAVIKNTSVDGATDNGGYYPNMFRVTAMGFGANPNSQVVLQTIIATQN